MFIPKQYCLGLNFKCNWARYMFTCHIWRPCVHTPHTFLHGPSQAHAVHTDTLSTGRAACPAVEPGAARAQETSHPPLSPSTVGSPSASELRLHPGVWGCFLGPFPPSSSGNPPLLAAWSGSRGLGRGFPSAQPAAAPLSPGPPCPPRRLRCWLAGWWPSSEQASSLRLPGCSYPGLRPPTARGACRRDVLRFLLASPSRWGGGPLGLPETLYWGRPSRRPPRRPPQTAPDGPQTGRARFPGESGFSGRGLCLAWQRLRPVSLLTSRACVACGWRGGG